MALQLPRFLRSVPCRRDARPRRGVPRVELLETRAVPAAYTLSLSNLTGQDSSSLFVAAYTNNEHYGLNDAGQFVPLAAGPLSSYPLTKVSSITIDPATPLTGVRVVFFAGQQVKLQRSGTGATDNVIPPAPTDAPYKDLPYDFIEFTTDSGGLHINTSQVDQFGFPITLSGGGQSVGVTPGVTRAQLLDAFTTYLGTQTGGDAFKDLVISSAGGDLRIVSPAKYPVADPKDFPWPTYFDTALHQVFEQPPPLKLRIDGIAGGPYTLTGSYLPAYNPAQDTTTKAKNLHAAQNDNVYPVLQFSESTGAIGPYYVYAPFFTSNSQPVTASVTKVAVASNVATLTTAAAHGFKAGQYVTVTGLTTDAKFNGTFAVTAVPDATHFTFALTHADLAAKDDAGTAAPVAKITKVAVSSNTVTLTTAAAHGLVVGQAVTVAGLSQDAAFNGTFRITAVADATHFSYALTHADLAESDDSGTAALQLPPPPTWIKAALQDKQSPGQYVFSGNGVFADNADVGGGGIGQFTPGTKDALVLGQIENQLVAALNRGIANLDYTKQTAPKPAITHVTVKHAAGNTAFATVTTSTPHGFPEGAPIAVSGLTKHTALNGNQGVTKILSPWQFQYAVDPSTPEFSEDDTGAATLQNGYDFTTRFWLDSTQYYPAGQPQNLYAEALHNAKVGTQPLFIGSFVYALSYDDQGGHAPFISFPDPSTVTLTLGPWDVKSTVQSFAQARTARPTFNVQWGTLGNVPAQSYDVLVSENGGAFKSFLKSTPLTSATFTGSAGNTYGFKSVATDLTGRTETPPAAVHQTIAVVTPHQLYVHGLYQRLLDRDADADGLAFWTALLDRGADRDAVARGLVTSSEHRGVQVDEFYRTYLGRAADAEGRSFWVRQMLGGLDEAAVRQALLNSAEYQARHADASSFVGSLYQDVLHRAGEPAGLAFWGPIAQAPASRATVPRGFVQSPEAHTNAVTASYQQYLGRTPDAGGQASALGLLDGRPTGPDDLAVRLLNSDEHLGRIDP